jgi:hypothetical protein
MKETIYFICFISGFLVTVVIGLLLFGEPVTISIDFNEGMAVFVVCLLTTLFFFKKFLDL